MNPSFDFQSIVSSPEFWMSIAFLGVVGAGIRPLVRYLRRWGQEKADRITNEIRQADELYARAQALLDKYQAHTAHKEEERMALLQEGDKEVSFLKQQAMDQLNERIQNKEEAVAFRLEIIRENSARDMKDKMTDVLLQKTQQLLKKESASFRGNDTDRALEMIFKTLDEYKEDLKRP